MLKVRLPDGSERRYDRPVTSREIVAEIRAGVAEPVLVAEADGRLLGLNDRLPSHGQVQLRLLTRRDPEALIVMRHSCAHLMARAVMRLFEGVQLGRDSAAEWGFYYHFDLPCALSEADFPAIEAEMKAMAERDEPFERIDQPRERAVEICRDLRQTHKLELIERDWSGEANVSFYQQGEFLDLCPGPHLPTAGCVGPFKLLSVAGGCWNGDSPRAHWQQLHGTAFFTQTELDEHLQRRDRAGCLPAL